MSIIGTGLSGLRASQAALSTTGNNVTNANTEGYSRQRVDLSASPSQFIGAGYLGQGVTIDNIRRVTDQYLVSQVRLDQSIFSEVDKLRENVAQIDSLLADATTGLAPAMSAFFGALQSAGDDPSSIPERQLLLTQADGLVNRFNVLYNRLDAQKSGVEQDIRAQVDRMNTIAGGLARLNLAISSSVGNADGKLPNDLLDQRDQLVRELSEIVSVTVIPGADEQVNILVGNGQALVIGNRSSTVQVGISDQDPTRLDVQVVENGNPKSITNELTGGALGGVLKFREEILAESFNSLGRIATVLTDTINEQHQLGMDLEGNFGGLFFDDINSAENMASRVFSDTGNALPNDRVINVEIIDSRALTTRDYRLEFTGPSDEDILITDARTGEKITRGQLTGFYPATFEFDGLRLRFDSGSFQQGDSFTIVPTRFGARDIDMNLTRVEGIALASPIRTETDLGNVGNAAISPGELLDVRSPFTDSTLPSFEVPGTLTPPVLVRFITDNYYEVLDNTDPANPVALNPPLNNVRYIQGVENPIFTNEPGQTALSALGTDVALVPAAVAVPAGNGYTGQTLTIQSRNLDTGIVSTQPALVIPANATAEDIAALLSARNGISATAYTEVTLSNFTDDGAGAAPTLRVNGELLTLPAGSGFTADDVRDVINANTTLQDQGLIARSDGTTVTLRALTGKDLQIEVVGDGTDQVTVASANGGPVVVGGGTGTQVGGFVDMRLEEGVRMTASSNTIFQQTPVAVSSYTGYTASINGTPKAGDRFSIEYNEGGVSDNRNAVAMAQLETGGTIGGGVSTYNEAYSQLVEVVGSIASQAEIDTESSRSLLQQSENRLSEVSGVNLDEEAGLLIQFQAAYNASAQVVSIARELFDTLLNTIR